MPGMSAEAARAFFPRGLLQPPGSFRFSLDALLLASFLAPAGKDETERLLDLGSGCGVVALGMLCRHPGLEAVGLDIRPELVEAARVNATRLGVADRFTSLCRDIAEPDSLSERAGSFSLVLANPPYRQRHRGRLPASPSRLVALFETEETLPAFCRTAARAMTSDGRFGVVFPAARREDLLSALAGAGLMAVRLLPVCARSADPPMLLLVEAVKVPSLYDYRIAEGKAETSILTVIYRTQLVLYESQSAVAKLTEQVIDFCPFLGCN